MIRTIHFELWPHYMVVPFGLCKINCPLGAEPCRMGTMPEFARNITSPGNGWTVFGLFVVYSGVLIVCRVEA